MGGGYGHRIEETVQVQLTTYRLALSYWTRWQVDRQGSSRVAPGCENNDRADY
jgi:hypothetical protein